jgi:GntR family transcriptional regulator
MDGSRGVVLQSAMANARPSRESEPSGPAFSPLYLQIKALLTQSLQSGEWKPGEAIPSEIELAARYKVSQGTVRKAIDELATENLVVRRQGKGTFVATHAEATTQYRFLRLIPDDGEPGGMEREFIDCRRQRAPADIVRALALKSGDAAIQVRRLLYFRGQPVVFDDIWLPGTHFKGLTAERLSEYRGPLYRLFEAEFGVRMIRAEEKIRAVAADAASAQLLELPVGAPLLSVERLAFTYGDKPVEVRRGLYNTAAHYYRNELS